jgi:hypothetical protein
MISLQFIGSITGPLFAAHRVIMRALVLIVISLAPACAAPEESPPDPAGAPASVREALTGGAALAIAPHASAGAITARQWRGRWEQGELAIRVDGGTLALSADRDGALALDDLHVTLAPIELPDRVFGEPARLTDLGLALAAAVAPTRATWDQPDAAHATLTVSVRLTWSLDTQGRVTPLGPVTLRDLPVELDVGGDPTHVTATVGVRAAGTVWTWAGLVELRDLALTLDADR